MLVIVAWRVYATKVTAAARQGRSARHQASGQVAWQLITAIYLSPCQGQIEEGPMVYDGEFLSHCLLYTGPLQAGKDYPQCGPTWHMSTHVIWLYMSSRSAQAMWRYPRPRTGNKCVQIKGGQRS